MTIANRRLVLIALVTAPLIAVRDRAPDAAPNNAKPIPAGTVTGTVKFYKDRRVQLTAPNAYAYLLPLRRPGYTPRPVTAAIQQKNRMFIPRVLVIPTGSRVAFPNRDTELHNVFSPTDPQFDLSRYGGGVSKSRVFADDGDYDIYCDIHFEMKAKVKVVDTDLIAPVNKGRFMFENVPPGRYKLVVWAPDSDEAREPSAVIVVAGQTTRVPREIHLRLGTPKTTHMRRDNTPYPVYTKP